MSSLDRALKKIYMGGDSARGSDAVDADAVDTTPDGAEDAAAGSMSDGSGHDVEQEVVDLSVSPSVEELYEAARATTLSIYHDAAASMPPSPHADFSTSRTPLWPSQRGAEQHFTEGAQAATLPAFKSRKRGRIDERQSRRETLRIDTSESPSLKPAFQVDRFVWPQPCDTLLEIADATLGQLTEALVAESRGGRKTWYLTSTRRAEGRTTLAICVARYLAQRGVPVALVDADFQNPQLARRLGVLPQIGWESVLAGSAPLTDAMIHATGAGVTLLPLLSACIDPAHVSQNARWSDTISQLRQHYTLVLIDGGPLGEGELDHGLIEHHGLADLDAALLLRDVRNTPLAELAATERRLSEAGLPYGAVAETFTAEV